MKITEVKAMPIRIPLAKPFWTASRAQISGFVNVLVKISTDEGVFGVGECDTIPTVSIETPEAIADTINRYVAPEILGEDPFDIERILEKTGTRTRINYSTKAGIDLALWDLKGKALKLPVYKLLGGMYKRKLPVDFTITRAEPKRMAEVAKRRVEQGYSTLVVKIGSNPQIDIERLKLVREAVGPDVKLRLDANEGYRPDQAIKTIRRMEKYDPELVEQPVSRWDLDGMGRVCKAVDTPISADEGNFTIQDALAHIRKGAADILNIKVTKNGGLYNSKKIAAIAEAADIPCLVGGMTSFEIARQASRHFAASTMQVNKGYAGEGPGPASQGLTDDITKKIVTFEEVSKLKGYVEISPDPGLGVELDNEKVKKYLAI